MADQLSTFYHNLSTLFDSGVPIVRSIKIASNGLAPKLARIITAAAEDVALGNTLSSAMRKHPHTFYDLDVDIIETGEVSGNLAECMQLLSQWHNFCQLSYRKLISGCLLPALVLHLGAFISPLPYFFLGRITIHQAILQAIKILAFFYILFASIFAIYFLSRNNRVFRKYYDIAVIKIPVLGRAIYHKALSRYCFVFNLMCRAGVPFLQCAEKASDLTGNYAVTCLVKGGYDSVAKGGPVYEGFSQKLSPEFRNVWQTGEQSGKLELMTKKLADMNAQTAKQLFAEIAFWVPRLIYWAVMALLVIKILQGFGTISYTRGF